MTDAALATALREIASLHQQIAGRLDTLAASIAQASDPALSKEESPLVVASQSTARLTLREAPVALRPWHSAHFPEGSMRWHAERALAEEGGPLSLDAWADRIRAQGFVHDWNPKNPRQLEASLTA